LLKPSPGGSRTDTNRVPTASSPGGLSPLTLVRRLRAHRYLLRQLVRKNVASAYQGSMGGIGWILIRPLLMLAIFTFVFGGVYRARFFQGTGDASIEFGLILFVGLTIFNVLAETLSNAAGLIVGNANFVKKVVFPLDVLVVAQLGSSLVQMGTSAVVIVVARLFFQPAVGAAALSIPFVLLPFLMLTLGVSWFLASLGVFIRDLQQVVPLFVTMLMFLSPLFYPVSAVPVALRSTLRLNPLTFPVESARNALFLNQWPDPRGLFVYFGVSTILMWLGWVWFEKTKKGFADVL
jgi:lipopolysaccharide transport system permease protein